MLVLGDRASDRGSAGEMGEVCLVAISQPGHGTIRVQPQVVRSLQIAGIGIEADQLVGCTDFLEQPARTYRSRRWDL